MIRRARISTVLLAVTMVAAACGPLVQVGGNSPAPKSLMTLRADPVETPKPADGAPLLITMPTVPGALRTLRIPVTTRDTEVAYLTKASWVEQPNILFRRMLVSVIQDNTGRITIDERNSDIVPAHRLGGTLSEFGLDVTGPEPIARVRYDAVLTSAKAGLVGARRFEAEVPVSSENGAAVVQALNAGANTVARALADWIATQN